MLAVLKHDVDVLGIVEVAMQLHDVRVVQSPLNFEFALHLGEKVELFQHVLKHNFKRHLQTCVTLHCLENFAKLAASNGLDTREVVYCPALSTLLLSSTTLRVFFLLFTKTLLVLVIYHVDFSIR